MTRVLIVAFTLLVGCNSRSGSPGSGNAPAGAQTLPNAERDEQARTLFNVGLAVRLCEDSGIPLDDIRDKNGKPLLSWRVRALMFLEREPLFKEFHLDEPWDSPHNRALLAKRPPEYARPGIDATETTLQLVRGPGTMFPGPKGIKPWEGGLPADAAAPFYLVEAAEAVPWTKPTDFNVSPDTGIPRLADVPGNALAVFADGKVRVIPKDTSEADLRSLSQVAAAGRVALDRLTEHPRAAAHRKMVDDFAKRTFKRN